jgi:hypothetical protein
VEELAFSPPAISFEIFFFKRRTIEKYRPWANMDLAITVVSQALLFGVMGHQRSQFCAMLVGPGGGQKEHL